MAEPSLSFTIAQVAEICGGQWNGPPSSSTAPITSVSTVSDAEPTDVTWITEEKHSEQLSECQAGAVVGTAKLLGEFARGIVVADPENAISLVLEKYYIPNDSPPPGVHPSASVHPSAKLAKNARVGPLAIIGENSLIGEGTIIHEGVSIGSGVRIGANCLLYDRCVVYDRCELGNSVILHAGVVIGTDGFGYIFREGRHKKLPHLGGVVIEDDVEIGANSVVARAKLEMTRIGRGTKIDALVMIAHNVQIGPLCILAGQVGLSGSVQLGTGVALGGQVGIIQGLRLGDGARAAAKSGIMKDVEAGQTVFGYPALPRVEGMRSQARIRQLPELFKQVAELSKRVVQLEASADHTKPR